MVDTIKNRSNVYCFKLNFNISNVGFSRSLNKGTKRTT